MTEHKKIVVGYLTSIDPMDKRSWSGTYYRMFRALEQQSFEVIPLGPVLQPNWFLLSMRILDKVKQLLHGKNFNKQQRLLKSKFFAYQFKKIIRNKHIDVIFSPASSAEIAHLDITIPICYLSDTSFSQTYGFYKDIYMYSEQTVGELNLIEQKVVDKCEALVYPTDWAAQYVIDHYHADPAKVHVLKFGPNLDVLPGKAEIGKNFEGHIKLLLLGVNWEMKGGDLAFGAFKILLDKGYNVSFTVCGCVPPITHEKMTVIPFLNKNSEEDLVKFRQLLLDCHLLILPTRIDCAPIVFCEAAAFGMPVVTTSICGVPFVVHDGVTGYTLPLEVGPEAYAERIQYLIDHPEKMTEMALRSREEFENELNWDVWGMKMKKILMDLLRQA